ncbi:hypothetical protein [Blastococcus sp. SYSU DS0617]
MFGPFRAGAPRECYCGAPADEDFLGMPRCARCAADDPVEEPADLARHVRPVFGVLRAAGVPLNGRIGVELVSREYYGPVLEGSGPLALGRIEEAGANLTITIVAGFPDALFRRVLSHHVGRAVLLGHEVADAPSWIADGVGEHVAHLYLGRPDASPAERLLDAEVGKSTSTRSLDPLRIRIVVDAIEREGLLPVLDALRAGQPASVGLA